MTRANLSPIVLDGSEVKLRVVAQRIETKSHVHVDWVRFTVYRRNVVPDFKPSWSPSDNGLSRKAQAYLDSVEYGSEDYTNLSHIEQAMVIRSTLDSYQADRQDPEFALALNQSLELGRDVVAVLGEGFTLSNEVCKGHDFYKYRLPVLLNEVEVGWVGFLASSDKQKQQAQNDTLHVNLYGQACTFAQAGWRQKMANLIDLHEAKLTRIDHALDFFDGFQTGYGMTDVLADYNAGRLDVNGRRLVPDMKGNWTDNGNSRSFYWGSKECGKQTNAYEKGDQLFGPTAGSRWIRFELRWGNKHRHLSSDMLRRPADFFGGASDYHADLLKISEAEFTPEHVPCEQRLPLETVQAEIYRTVQWVNDIAGSAISTCFRFMGDEFLELVNWETKRLPSRLRTFTDNQIRDGFKQAASQLFKAVSIQGPSIATGEQLAHQGS